METTSLSTDGFTFNACCRFGNLGATSRNRECEQQGRDLSVKAFLGGAACAVIWGALWWLLIYAYQFPPKSAGVDVSAANSAATSALPRSAPQFQVPGAATCRPGTVGLNGSCVVGEEIEVRAPAGWSGR